MYVVSFDTQKCTAFVLCRYTPELQATLAENVYLTGGNFLYPGVKERVERELLAMRPFQSHFKVTEEYIYTLLCSSDFFLCNLEEIQLFFKLFIIKLFFPLCTFPSPGRAILKG